MKPVTARGVSAAKVVATMLVPRTHQGRERPDRKYCSVDEEARLRKARPRARVSDHVDGDDGPVEGCRWAMENFFPRLSGVTETLVPPSA